MIARRPQLLVECAFNTSPFVDLADESLAWTDLSAYVELDKGLSVERRRANELDEPSAGTASVTLDNSGGRFTPLNTTSPYAGYLKVNRLLRIRSRWPEGDSLLNRQQGTGGQATRAHDGDAGWYVPAGTLTTETATATAGVAGSTTTLLCVDADATDIDIGDVVTLNPALNANAGFEAGTTGWGGFGGTFTQANDQVYSGAWSGKLVPSGTDFFSFLASDWQTYTAGQTYTVTARVRCAVARTIQLQIHWYNAAAAFISASTTSVAVAAGTWAEVTLTAVAPTSATQGPALALMDGTPPGGDILWVDEFAVRDLTPPDSYHAVTGKASAAGTTTFTFAPAADTATVPGDVMTRVRAQWDTGLQAVTGARLSAGRTNTTTAGPDAIHVTEGLAYTWSAYASRGATAISVSPRILWYDQFGTAISESTGSTTALTTTLQRLTFTATAPAGAALARIAVANETVFAGSPTIAYRSGDTAASQSALSITPFVPADAQAGDGMLAWVSATTTEVITAPTGWTLVGTVTDGTSPYQGRTWLFKAIATSSASYTRAGHDVPFNGSEYGRKVAVLEVWSGTDPAECVHQVNSVAEGATATLTHTTPNVTTTLPNCWIVSAVFDRSSATSAWTQPGGDILRNAVYTTGSGVATGCVSDNATAVAAGLYGSKVFTSNRSAAIASMWTVALKPSPTSGSSSGTVYTTGWQFEQAAAASDWQLPPADYIHFTGHVDEWPMNWENGVRSLASITATDRTKLLDDEQVGSALTQQLVPSSPLLHYPLSEEAGATTAGNASPVTQSSLPIVSAGAVTDEMLEFGAGTGPGTDAQPALVLAPASSSVGKALRGRLLSPLGGPGVTGMTVAVIFNSTLTAAGTRVLAGADDGKLTDSGAIAILDISIINTPIARAHLKMQGGVVDMNADYAENFADGHTHMAVATAFLTGGAPTVRLYMDGVFLSANTQPDTFHTEFPRLNRWNVGCGAIDGVGNLFPGTLSHCIGWNRALDDAEIADLWAAAETGFAGDLPGERAARIADWAGMNATAWDAGASALEGHPSGEQSLADAFKTIARSEGGVFFVAPDGDATLHDRARRTNARSAFTVHAHQLEEGLTWRQDPQLIANDVTVRRTNAELRVTDQESKDDYGTQPADIATILADDDLAVERGEAYLARYAQPISRPQDVQIEALNQPAMFEHLLGARLSDLFTIDELPEEAPAPSVEVFIEGVGLAVTPDSWMFAFDCSPAGFDFGGIFDHPTRGVFDSPDTVFGW